MTGTGVLTIHFLGGAFTDTGGATNAVAEEQFFLVSTPGAKPKPSAALASPSNGTSVTAGVINGQRYIDVTYTSHDGTPIRAAPSKTRSRRSR